MNELTLQATFAGLLHDIGKLVWRAGLGKCTHAFAGAEYLKAHFANPKAQNFLACVQYHHEKALRAASLPVNHPAYITCAADSIAASIDRRGIESGNQDYDASQPLLSIFSHLNGEHPKQFVAPIQPSGNVPFPVSAASAAKSDYEQLLHHFEQGLSHIGYGAEWLNALLALLEECTSTVPASTYRAQSEDVSLYDHLKVTAAVSACISEYLLAQKTDNYRDYLQSPTSDFRKTNVFLLYTADISGIQKFIYTVATRGAQRALRSRSFFLELFMENYIDLVLDACGLSRANLLYSGGGHCYLLLPNTDAVRATVREVNRKTNDWLIAQFGIQLFLANGWCPCSADALCNRPAEESPYKEIFAKASAVLSQHKLQRYSVAQIKRLNQFADALSGRECTVCGRVDNLQENRCPWCRAFENISRKLQNPQYTAFCITRDSSAYDLTLPDRNGQDVSLLLLTEDEAAKQIAQDRQMIRLYGKNRTILGAQICTRLDLCDYYASNLNTSLAAQSEGIRRLAICRMDVDNLGEAFISGFEQKDKPLPKKRYHFVTLSRTTAFSRQMSLFFKRYMNLVLTQNEQKPLQIAVIYSGGDDVFLLGAWNDVITAATRIADAFHAYTSGALTISAGIGMYDAKYPIRMAAEETAALEQRAKNEPGKNAIALFDPQEHHTYSWPVFTSAVLGEKYQAMKTFFDGQDERRMAFLYNITQLLRLASIDKLNLARLAYLLARLKPSSFDKEKSAQYDAFSKAVYRWAAIPQERDQLITAIYLYVYLNRKVEDSNGLQQ